MDHRESRLSRRAFVVGTGAAALVAGCGRLPGQPEPPPAKVFRLGYLSSGSSANDLVGLDIFRQSLRELGYAEGQNILIEPRYAEAQYARLPELAAELVGLPVDLLLTTGPVTPQAARDATRTIPIVMVYPRDPVADGIVASLARPGGNVTGLTNFADQLAPKRLQLLKEAAPGLSRVAYLWAADEAYRGVTPVELADSAAETLGIVLQSVEVRGPGEIDAAFQTALENGAEAIFVTGQPAISAQRSRVVGLAAQHRLPAMYSVALFVRDGGLMSYAVNSTAQARRAGYFVDRILRGAKPADLPVEQPMTFDFVVNLKTAQTLGIMFPNEIMLQVTEAIQ